MLQQTGAGFCHRRVDLVLGAEQKGDILRYLEERLPLLPAERKLADAEHEAYTVPTKDIHTFVLPVHVATGHVIF